MQHLRKKFPVLNQSIYANTASAGLLSEDLMEWRQGHDLDYLIGGSDMKNKGFAHMPEIKKAVGKFFHCKPENVALVPNFSLGFNLLLEGMPKNKKVLLLNNDYPSVNWPFETRNFDRAYVDIDEDMEDHIYEKVKSENIDIFVLSLVQWVNGVKIDFEFLKQLKKEFPNLMIIADGTQYCGQEPFNFEKSGIDILGASAYKWLLAGYGNGFFLVKDGIKDQFELKGIGNGSVNNDASQRNNISFCKFLEPGHLDSFNFGSLEFALEFLDEIGQEHIQTQLKKLSKKGMETFSELGLLEPSITKRKEHSTIFSIKGDEKLFNKLTAEDVVASLRGGGIRLSFHFYNTEEEIDVIGTLLKRWSSKG
ncbi:aminotransferase class V-fold PLP-dependent enzyme [Flagellimonas zhangzhouensis]|uniref:Selenocysteine lyase/Cysteine desulfurase n=1 Tax=Flagellimonas zhangzhouensis TaxID=1073328 RepID=A0A1H2X5F6_9FLAO|nr:aminotransferase class V-fold PLP-dependent enzyme [Allomuricauda zhangzhouensis]SDQ28212.1 Selenocysteine lyase/Cysteine desulfurase [Allomuricauda zhangzhouensis]SDW88021.1 Selenocysteine lyase/Cysteine desulfurase [Allomuricauda zhangzhouensis]